VAFEIIKNTHSSYLSISDLENCLFQLFSKKISIKELLAPITSSTPQRTSSFHERTDKEPVVLLAVV
jgi:hypothetical protein